MRFVKYTKDDQKKKVQEDYFRKIMVLIKAQKFPVLCFA